MILLAALFLGLLAGWVLAIGLRQTYRAPELKYPLLAPVALLPQVLVTVLPGGRALPAQSVAALALPASLILFGVFAWLNRRVAGMALVMVGLLMNLAVIGANGGWMPVSPATASQLPGAWAEEAAITGIRVGDKDILLRPEDTRLEFLADRFLLPPWMGYRAAFSAGDAVLAAGIFWILASPPMAMRLYRSKHADLNLT